MDVQFNTDPASIIIGSIYIFIGILAIFGNGINIAGYLGNKKIHNVNNKFIIAMTVSDFLQGPVAIFLSLFYLIPNFDRKINEIVCGVQYISFTVTVVTTINVICLIGFNRYIYVAYNQVNYLPV